LGVQLERSPGLFIEIERKVRQPDAAAKALLINGKITLTPQRPHRCSRENRSGGSSGASSMISTTEVVEIGSCAGAIRALEHVVFKASSWPLVA